MTRPPPQPTPHLDARPLRHAARILESHGYPLFAQAVRDIGEAIERRAQQSETGHDQEQE
jgi:hypothetical protein